MQIADVVVVCDWETRRGNSKFQIISDILSITAGSVGLFFNPGISIPFLILGCVGLVATIISYRKSKKK